MIDHADCDAAVTVTLRRTDDLRSWLATFPGDGQRIGIGPTPAAAVASLWRWGRTHRADDRLDT